MIGTTSEKPAIKNIPLPSLGRIDTMALIVGLVIGVGIFRTPPLVAANTESFLYFIGAWIVGGLVSVIGALCYAELASHHPNSGGDYHFLTRAFGTEISFLFAWARMMVIQTGSIAILGFVFGDYASTLYSFGEHSSSIYALIAVSAISVLNIVGLHHGKGLQNILVAFKLLGLAIVIIAGIYSGFLIPEASTVADTATEANGNGFVGSFGLAMVFVLLTYGGWNEAAYLSADLKDVRKNISRSLIGGIVIITVVYVLVNVALYIGLGREALIASEAVGADLMAKVFGTKGVWFISGLVVIASLSSMNATIITGARTNYALGQDHSLFSFLGHWTARNNAPTHAIIFQTVIVFILIWIGAIGRGGFETMVDYTAPIFWFFFLMTGLSVFILRNRGDMTPGAFRVPFFPVLPLAFCMTCIYMLQSSLSYTGPGAMVGVLVLIAGIPLLFFSRRKNNPAYYPDHKLDNSIMTDPGKNGHSR